MHIGSDYTITDGCISFLLEVPSPVSEIIPERLRQRLERHCVYNGTGMDMLLAALLAATASAIASKTRVYSTKFGEERQCVPSFFMIASADAGKAIYISNPIHSHVTQILSCEAPLNLSVTAFVLIQFEGLC